MIVNLKPYALTARPAEGTAYGRVLLGETMLCWKNGLRWYGVDCREVCRAWRQEENVYGKLCCGGRSYVIHRLVLVTRDGTKLTIHIGDDTKPEAEGLITAMQAAFPGIVFGKE